MYDERLKEVDAALKKLADYKKSACPVSTRDQLMADFRDLITATELGLDGAKNILARADACEARIACEEAIRNIQTLLDRGDTASALARIEALKQRGCNTKAIEDAYGRVLYKVYPLWQRASEAWAKVATSCDYEGAYQAALALRQEFPEHPFVVENFTAIEQAAKAQRDVNRYLSQATNLDSQKRHEAAALEITKAEQAAAPYPCLSEAVRRYREVFEAGLPNSDYLRLLQEALRAIQNCQWEKALNLRAAAREIEPQDRVPYAIEEAAERQLDSQLRSFADAEAAVRAAQREFRTARTVEDWQRL